MSLIKKLKNLASETEPSYIVEQKISQTIYSLDINSLIDAGKIKDKCLLLKHGQNGRPELVKQGWQSRYYIKNTDLVSNEQYNNFSELISLVENKVNRIVKSTMYEIQQFWIVVYTDGSRQEFHNHIPDNPQLINFSEISAVYYPLAPDNSSPIEFINDSGANLQIPVRSGNLVIFPSSSIHGVPTHNQCEMRIAIAFNLGLKNNMKLK